MSEYVLNVQAVATARLIPRGKVHAIRALYTDHAVLCCGRIIGLVPEWRLTLSTGPAVLPGSITCWSCRHRLEERGWTDA